MAARDAFDGLALLVAVPFVALVLGCYVKVAVVLSVLRSGLGGAVPPRSVNAVVAVLLAAFVVAPVAERMWRLTEGEPASGRAVEQLAGIGRASEPLREFLERRAPARERASFLELARRLRPPAERDAVGERDLAVLAPAFVFAELKAAFQVGFLLLLPFLVLELVIASLLAALGMHTLDARAVSLPFKLLLFVLADGWHLLARGLVLGYT